MVLEALGVGADAETAYGVAFNRETWARDDLVAEVAKSTRLTQAEAEAAVTTLLELQLLRPAQAADGELRVVAPGVALQARLSAERSATTSRQHLLDEAARMLSFMEDAYTRAREARIEHAIERVTGIDAVHSRLEQLAQGTRTELLSLLPVGTLTDDSIVSSSPLDEQTLRRGVAVRSVCVHSALRSPDVLFYLRWMSGLGAQARSVATLPMRMIICDREVAVIPADVERPREGALIIRTPGVLTALVTLFETTWRTARPLDGSRAPVPGSLSDTDREVLRILATGATDEVVARQLGVSERTVRRITSLLTAQYGARSRFELGLRLGAAGWMLGECRDEDGDEDDDDRLGSDAGLSG